MGILFVVVLFVLAGVLAVIYYRSQVKAKKLVQDRKDRGEAAVSVWCCCSSLESV